jgi:hypothetical protein
MGYNWYTSISTIFRDDSSTKFNRNQLINFKNEISMQTEKISQFIWNTSWKYTRLVFKFLGVGWDWVHLVRRPQFGLLYQARMINDECGAAGGMRIGRRNGSTRRKPAPVPFCPPQIPLDLTWARTRAAAVGSRRLTAWPSAQPSAHVTEHVTQR